MFCVFKVLDSYLHMSLRGFGGRFPWPKPEELPPLMEASLASSLVNGSNVCHEPDAVAIILFDYDWWLATDNLSIHTHTPLWYDGAVTLVFPPDKKNAKKG